MLIQHTVIIRKPLAAVESYLTDISNNCKWQEDVSESGVLTDGDIGIGTKGFEKRIFMNVSFRTEWVVTAYTPGKTFAFSSSSSIAPYDGKFDYESVEGGTKVTFSFDIQNNGIHGLFNPIMKSVFSPRFRGNLDNLVSILENGSTSTTKS